MGCWKVDPIRNADGEIDSEERPNPRRRAAGVFVLRYYRLLNLEQCELPQPVLDKLPKIATHQHDAEAAGGDYRRSAHPPETQYAGSKAIDRPITRHLASIRAFTSST